MKSIFISIALCASTLLFASCDKCKSKLDGTCICTEQYEPVCGCDNKTYGNACMADCAKVDYKQGECK